MSLPVITVKEIKHRNQFWFGIFFDYDSELIERVKEIPDRRWSQSKKCWYIPFTKNSLEQSRTKFKGLAELDYSAINDATYTNLKIRRPPDNQTREILGQFEKFLQGRRYSSSTIKTYSYMIRDFLMYLEGKSLSEINQRDVELYSEEVLARNNSSISTHRQFIGALKKFQERFSEIAFVISNDLRPKQSIYLPTVLSQQEIIALLQRTTNIKHRVALAMIYSCGLRISELLNLELSAIDFNRRQVKICQSKGRKDRYVVLAESIIPLMNNYLMSISPVKYFIEGKPGFRYSAESVRKFLRRSCQKAGIKKRVTPHILRHSYATHLMESGIGERYIQELLGHKSIRTTMIYTHVTKKSLAQVRSPLDDAVKQIINEHNTDKKVLDNTSI